MQVYLALTTDPTYPVRIEGHKESCSLNFDTVGGALKYILQRGWRLDGARSAEVICTLAR